MGGEGDKEEKPLGRVRGGRERKGETQRERVGGTTRERERERERSPQRERPKRKRPIERRLETNRHCGGGWWVRADPDVQLAKATAPSKAT